MLDPKSDSPLDLGSLRAALRALADAVDVVSSPEFATAYARWRATLISRVVQHFGLTFELCRKMLKRQLERELPSFSKLDGSSYRELFRLGHERGLVSTIDAWFEFRELPKITAHTHSREKAHKVAAGAPALLAARQALLIAIESRNHG